MRLAWLGGGALLVACGGPAFTTGGGDASVDGASGPEASAAEGAAAEGGGAEGGSAEAGGGEGGAAEGGAAEGGAAEGGLPDGGAVACGPKTQCSGTTAVCCLGGAGTATTPTCAHLSCGCADTQLECSSDSDCALPQGSCCINKTNDATCASGHVVARCAVTCLNGSTQVCDPSAPQCTTGQCSTDAGDLQNAGLPADGVYGVCK